VLIGGFRAELRPDRVDFSEETTAEVLVGSCPSDDGFLHFVDGGGLFWSKTFLGPLEQVGLARNDLNWRVVQCGPVVVALSADGQPNLVVSKSGIRALGRSDLALVHFSSAERGRAIMAPDRLLETHDGGRTLVEVASRPSSEGDDPPTWLGTRIDIERVDEASWDQRHRPEADRVRTAWVRHAVLSNVGRVAGGLRLSDGTWVRSLAIPMRTFFAFRTPSGRVSDYSVDGVTRFFPWGNALLALLDEAGGSLYALRADGQERLPPPPRPPRAVAADPKGRWIAALSHPWDASGKPAPSALMTFEGQSWQDHAGLRVEPLAVGSGRILAQRHEGGAVLLSVVAPEREPVELSGEKLGEHGVSLLERFAVYKDRGLPADDPTALRRLTWYELGSGVVVSTAPVSHDLYRIRFADESHGIAVEGRGGLRVTSDAGRTFTQAPVEGTRPDPRKEIRCWPHGCSFAETVAFTDEPLGAEPSPAPSPTAKIDEPPAGPGDRNSDIFPKIVVAPSSRDATVAPRYRCRATPPLPSQDLQRSFAVRDFSGRVPAAGGFVERQGGTLSFRGHDETGDFRVVPQIAGSTGELLRKSLLMATSMGPDDLGLPIDVTTIFPVLVRRGFAIVLRGEHADTTDGAQKRLCVVHVNGRSDCLFDAPDMLAEAWPLPAGGAVVNVGAPGRQEVFVLDADGGLRMRRWFAGLAGRMTIGSDGVGLLVQEEERKHAFSLIPGSPGVEVTWRIAGAFADCTRPPSPGSTIVALDAPDIELSGSGFPVGYSPLRVGLTASFGLLEIGPRGGCWRGAVLSHPFPLELRATGGVMRGTVVGPERSHSLICQRAPKGDGD
jgi:hypothetical protein